MFLVLDYSCTMISITYCDSIFLMFFFLSHAFKKISSISYCKITYITATNQILRNGPQYIFNRWKKEEVYNYHTYSHPAVPQTNI